MVVIMPIIQFNSLFYCAASTAERPITDTAQKRFNKKVNEHNNNNKQIIIIILYKMKLRKGY